MRKLPGAYFPNFHSQQQQRSALLRPYFMTHPATTAKRFVASVLHATFPAATAKRSLLRPYFMPPATTAKRLVASVCHHSPSPNPPVPCYNKINTTHQRSNSIMLFKTKKSTDKNTKKAIEKSLNEIQINLENNYKDLAITAYKKSSELIENAHQSNSIDDKAYNKYKSQLDTYSEKMKGYSHRLNIKY